MKRFYTTLLFLPAFIWYSSLWSQQDLSWRKHLKAAESALEDKNYQLAGSHYESAWEKKNKKIDLCYLAGEAYAMARNYEKAAYCYEQVRLNGTQEYPYLVIKQARALKQAERYEEALTAFGEFIDTYSGEGQDVLREIVQTEIAGCQLAEVSQNAEVYHLGGDLNTSANEIAPLPLSDDLLYYTADIGASAKIYRSKRQGNLWSKGSTPENFPIIPGGQYGYGSLSPTGTSYYFSICEPSATFQAGETRCEIFVTYRRGALWTQPQRLPDHINQAGITATQPFVVHENDMELLYFVSNRNEGFGKLDLWVATRPIYPESINFSNPQNLGPSINTIGDEVAPFYDQVESQLYFSSNGQIGYGGLDIFSVEGTLNKWKQPINLGKPINSGADDAYFVKLKDRGSAFFASNRKSLREKEQTLDDDLFEVLFTVSPVFLEATAYDLATSAPLQEMRILVEEVIPGGVEVLHDKSYNDGHYRLAVLPDKAYKVTIQSPGYKTTDYTFTTNIEGQKQYGKARFLELDIENVEPVSDPITEPVSDPITETENADVSDKDKVVVPPQPPIIVPETAITTNQDAVPTKTQPAPPVIPPETTINTTQDAVPTKTQQTEISDILNEEEENKIISQNREENTPAVKLYNGRPVIEGYVPGQLYIARGTSRGDKLIYRSTSPRYRGIYYKIQVTALAKPNLDIPLFNPIRSLGQLTDEYLIDKNLSRILLGDFFSLQEASDALQSVWLGGVTEAYLVKYEDGSRYGRVNPY